MARSVSQYLQISGEAVMALFRNSPGFVAELSGAGTLALSGEPFADLNLALIHESPDSARCVDAFSKTVVRAQVPCLFLLENAEQTAAKNSGLLGVGSVPLMVCSAEKPLKRDCSLRIRRVALPEDLSASCGILADAFSISEASMERVFCDQFLLRPDVQLFVAFQDQVPVSTLQVTQWGSAAGIWSMATGPAYQRRGIGTEFLTSVMNELRSHGCNDFYLMATEAGVPLYKALGFREMARLDAFVIGAPA